MPPGTSGSVLVVIVGPPSPVGTGPTLPTTAGQRHAGLPKAHKVSGGYVVEKRSLVQTKQSSLVLGQGGFNDDSLGRQAIQVAVERIFGQEWEINLQDIRQRGGANPIGRGQFAGRVNQSVERHGAGELPEALTEAGLGEDCVQAQTLPKLITGVDGPCLARFFGAHLIDMNGQQVGVGGSRVSRVGRPRRWSSGLHSGEEILQLAVGRGSVEEVGLAGQSGGEFVSQGEPLGMGTRAEVAEEMGAKSIANYSTIACVTENARVRPRKRTETQHH